MLNKRRLMIKKRQIKYSKYCLKSNESFAFFSSLSNLVFYFPLTLQKVPCVVKPGGSQS